MIDPLRHLEVFSPDQFGDRRVDVIGAGATGSRIALSLSKLGVQNIHVWDFDEVAPHNIANQLYRVNDVGRPKVEALAELIHEQTGDEITIHNEAFTPGARTGPVMFVLTDTMASRKEIFESMRTQLRCELLVETRMGADSGRVYAFTPCKPDQATRYEGTLYSDDETEVEASLCGTSITVNATADLVAGYAVWQFVRWWRFLNSEADEIAPEFELLFGVRSPIMMATA